MTVQRRFVSAHDNEMPARPGSWCGQRIVREGLHLGGRVHVRPDRDGARLEVGQAVRAADHALVIHTQHPIAVRLHQRGKALPQPGWRLAFQQTRGGPLGDRIARGLRDIPDVGRAGGDHPGAHRLAGFGLLEPAEPPPRRDILRGRGREPARNRGEDHVSRLPLRDLPAKRLPLLVPGDIRRLWVRHPALLERLQVLDPDQQRVPERTRPEPGRELERTMPVIPGHQSLDCARQPFVQLVKLRVARRSYLFACRHR